ncbi:hypothetical protein GPJ56_000842 [Histomonas meleagridis]|uniref:uncharacterized protein n=1 Tax=Histomonas meleagridis TaxID=135588 RepID=UPI003559691D|nr:hypothetical protein GPJ56_000842 [Histomonas meleagridis]KAH0801326.1 hypothetical protein GO595_005921 [Histomonas meleagridis]
MFALLLAASTCFTNNEITDLAQRSIPKALYFENLGSHASHLQGLKFLEISGSGNKINVKVQAGNRQIMETLVENKGKLEVFWVQSDDFDGWTYLPSSSDESNKIAMHYMVNMVNSIEPPTLVRSISERTCVIDGEEHHQMTIIINIMGTDTLQMIEYKLSKKYPQGHTLVTHNVVLREGEEF